MKLKNGWKKKSHIKEGGVNFANFKEQLVMIC